MINTQCEFEENKLPLSKDFWNNYKNIKNFKPNYKTGRSDIALEAKALENLKVYSVDKTRILSLVQPKNLEIINEVKSKF